MLATLIELTPNYFGKDRWYSYRGNLETLEPLEDAEAPTRRATGWLVRFRDLFLRRHSLAVFVHDGAVHADFGWGAADREQVSVAMRTILNITAISVVQGTHRARYVVVTPPLRYLTNDGRFPESIEPVRQAVSVLASKRSAKSFADSISATT